MQALFATPISDMGVECHLCPHECVLKPGQTGICRTRTNVAGQLLTMAYGAVCAAHIDPVEKKPLFHFLPGSRTFSIATAGCNLRCMNCQNVQISQHQPVDIPSEHMSPQQIVDAALHHGCKSISYTYTDPVVYYEYAYDTARLAHLNGLKNIVVSAGYINEEPLKKWCKEMDAANIDLKSFDDHVYRKLCGASLAPVLRTLEILRKEHVWLEITRLMVPGMTDGADDIDAMCGWLVAHDMTDVPLHLSRFYPHHQLAYLAPTSVLCMEQACRIACDWGMKYVYVGNLPHQQREHTFCHVCHSLLIERSGFSVDTNQLRAGACPHCGGAVPGIWD